ncbi:hypothetical protein EON65_37480 [archaeon]|nr:MAG: hypothetical protein EON65_37480 [archaeon]
MTAFADQQMSKFLYATSNFLALPFETSFRSHKTVNFTANNWPMCIGFVIGYMVFIFGAQHIMKDRKPFDLRLALAGWNAFLCVFSFIGMCRTVSANIDKLQDNSGRQLIIVLYLFRFLIYWQMFCQSHLRKLSARMRWSPGAPVLLACGSFSLSTAKFPSSSTPSSSFFARSP